MQNNVKPYMAPRSKVFGRIHLQDCYNQKRELSCCRKEKKNTAQPFLNKVLLCYFLKYLWLGELHQDKPVRKSVPVLN